MDLMIIGVGVGIPLVLGAVLCLGWWVRRQVECKASRSRVLGPLGQYVELVERISDSVETGESPEGLGREKGLAALGEIERRVRREMSIHQSIVGKRWISQVQRCLEQCREVVTLSEGTVDPDAGRGGNRMRRLEKMRESVHRAVYRLHE